jgi:glucose dehydrogenase
MAAISDSGGPDPESYKFFWKEGEEDERRKQMLTLAADELRVYVNARAKGAIVAIAPAKSAATTQKHKVPMKPAPPEFVNIQFTTFDVWRNNQPVMILSAEAHFPIERETISAPETYSITLVSRTDIYGSLRKLHSAVTDKFHLDVTPRLELIDAVDADGDGRGELVFRETTDGGSGYVIYRATGDKLWKMFDSLKAE